jgi:cell division protein FtsQ
MDGMVSISRSDLEGRRKKLRQKRQIRIIQGIWQSLAVSALAGGLLWIAIQPIWVLKTPKDIVISGNYLLSDEAIQSLLVLSYPQSLWRIEPSEITNALEQQPTIAQATVTRRLFPPGIIVEVTERVPVAIAQTHREQSNGVVTNKKVTLGLLDANGVWMPLEKHTSLNPAVKLPSLKVIGFPEQYRSFWAELYQELRTSSLQVTEIDCQDVTNLILKTEIGPVHLGVPSSRLREQIKVIEQMRNLPTLLNPSKIEYIDLKNPESPIVQMNPKTRPNS